MKQNEYFYYQSLKYAQKAFAKHYHRPDDQATVIREARALAAKKENCRVEEDSGLTMTEMAERELDTMFARTEKKAATL